MSIVARYLPGFLCFPIWKTTMLDHRMKQWYEPGRCAKAFGELQLYDDDMIPFWYWTEKVADEVLRPAILASETERIGERMVVFEQSIDEVDDEYERLSRELAILLHPFRFAKYKDEELKPIAYALGLLDKLYDLSSRSGKLVWTYILESVLVPLMVTSAETEDFCWPELSRVLNAQSAHHGTLRMLARGQEALNSVHAHVALVRGGKPSGESCFSNGQLFSSLIICHPLAICLMDVLVDQRSRRASRARESIIGLVIGYGYQYARLCHMLRWTLGGDCDDSHAIKKAASSAECGRLMLAAARSYDEALRGLLSTPPERHVPDIEDKLKRLADAASLLAVDSWENEQARIMDDSARG